MADDTPELGRLVVLHSAVLAALMGMMPKTGDQIDFLVEQDILREIDALTMRISHRSRSAANYQNTARGMAALKDAQQIVEALANGKVASTTNEFGKTDATYVEIVDYVWDKDQLDNPLQAAGEEPRRKIVRRWYVDRDLRFLSPELNPDADHS